MHDRDRKCLADTFQEYELSDYHVRPQRKLYGLSIDYHATYGHSESFFFVFVCVGCQESSSGKKNKQTVVVQVMSACVSL